MTKEQRIETMTKMLHECAKKEGGSSDDVNNILAEKDPTTKGGKCTQACMGETIGIVSFSFVINICSTIFL